MYSKQAFDHAYANIIHPINDPNLWEKTDSAPIIPPTMKKQPGRPKKNRRLEEDEVRDSRTGTVRMKRTGVSIKCARCKQQGHNIIGCPKKPKTKQSAQPSSEAVSESSQPSAQVRIV